MDSLVFTQLSVPEIRQLFRQELETYFSVKRTEQPQPETDQLLTIQQVADFLSLSVPTIYGLVSKAEIPCMKRGKRLYFSKDEISNWIKAGRKKTLAELGADADAYLLNQKKRG